MRNIRLVCFLLSFLCSSWTAVIPTVVAVEAPPNVLIMLADDCTFSDLSIYGGKNAKTPNIEQLAQQGLVFNRAYVSAAMCQPCRAELYTGLFPMRNGCAWNHSACRPGTRSLPQHLQKYGYRSGIAGKVHVKPDASFPFEDVPGFDSSGGRDPTNPHNLTGIREFMARSSSQPFCLVVAMVEPHVPWVMGDPSQYPVDQLKLTPNLADTPKTRQDYASYLAEITYMDGQVGQILQTLEELKLAENTLVFFSSEQGAQFPGNKWTCWDVGLHTTLIARWPGKVVAGTRTDAMVQYADITPTLIDIAGGATDLPQLALDGSSFADVLRGSQSTHRRYAYAAHNNVPEGTPYPVRAITDGQWRYIRNLTPDTLFIEKHLMGLLGGSAVRNAYWSSWMATAGESPETYRLVQRYMLRPAEELYHTARDPSEMTNLIDQPQHAEIQKRLSAELDRWLAEQNDPGIPMDTTAAHDAAKRGRPLFPSRP